MSQRTLILPVKREYFEAIRDNKKLWEYRLRTPYWRKRIEEKEYDRITITLGYPARDDWERRITYFWRGFEERTITHPLFGSEPVDTYAIRVGSAWV